MQKRRINLVNLEQYKLEDDQFGAIHGGDATTCTCASCTCTCAVEPSAEWVSNSNDGSNTEATNTLNGLKGDIDPGSGGGIG